MIKAADDFEANPKRRFVDHLIWLILTIQLTRSMGEKPLIRVSSDKIKIKEDKTTAAGELPQTGEA